MSVLIHKTATTPEITLKDIQAVSDFGELEHMRDVIMQCASQVGLNACQDALEALERVEQGLR